MERPVDEIIKGMDELWRLLLQCSIRSSKLRKQISIAKKDIKKNSSNVDAPAISALGIENAHLGILLEYLKMGRSNVEATLSAINWAINEAQTEIKDREERIKALEHDEPPESRKQ